MLRISIPAIYFVGWVDEMYKGLLHLIASRISLICLRLLKCFRSSSWKYITLKCFGNACSELSLNAKLNKACFQTVVVDKVDLSLLSLHMDYGNKGV